jgi:hypothetical protein
VAGRYRRGCARAGGAQCGAEAGRKAHSRRGVCRAVREREGRGGARLVLDGRQELLPPVGGAAGRRHRGAGCSAARGAGMCCVPRVCAHRTLAPVRHLPNASSTGRCAVRVNRTRAPLLTAALRRRAARAAASSARTTPPRSGRRRLAPQWCAASHTTLARAPHTRVHPSATHTDTLTWPHVCCAPFGVAQEALRAEIERKRKLKDAEFGGRKFMKVSDLDAAREAAKRGAAGAAAPAAEGGAEVRCVVLAHRLGLGTACVRLFCVRRVLRRVGGAVACVRRAGGCCCCAQSGAGAHRAAATPRVPSRAPCADARPGPRSPYAAPQPREAPPPPPPVAAPVEAVQTHLPKARTTQTLLPTHTSTHTLFSARAHFFPCHRPFALSFPRAPFSQRSSKRCPPRTPSAACARWATLRRCLERESGTGCCACTSCSAPSTSHTRHAS